VSDAILTLFRLGFLALVWFFFVRIAQSVWTSVTPAVVEPALDGAVKKSKRSRKNPAVVILEPLEHAGLVFPIQDQLTIGRSASCDVTLDDTFVSSHHARVARTESGLMVSDLGSTNGTYVDRQRVITPIPIGRGSRLQIGSTLMEVR
jgi:pSer/pThr/pTyr-binding forkhead associated (FHA) protein